LSPLPGRQSDIWAQVAYYTGLGFILPAGVVAGYILGWYVDRWLHTSPILAVALGFLGAAGGFIEILNLLKRAEKRAGGNDSGTGPGQS
jgi:F0F1-type ATP synthase assembly protein I